jgi:hypothetical protein
MLRTIGLPELLVLLGVGVLLLAPLWIMCFWRIFSRAGLPGALSFLMIVPIVNWVVIGYFAFADWPVLRELQDLRQRYRPGAV